MWLSRYFVYFIIFSCMGWIYESIYCTIRAKKWENRGFLYGPLCPIYGAGGVAITAIADFISAHTDATFTWWQIFLVAFLGSINNLNPSVNKPMSLTSLSYNESPPGTSPCGLCSRPCGQILFISNALPYMLQYQLLPPQ
mgnify:CR=1 FL=1